MTKVITREIDNCYHCLNFRDFTWRKDDDFRCHLVTVGRNFRIVQAEGIPNWCPLEDKE